MEPARPLSTGLGPVSGPPFSPARGWNQRSPVTIRSHRRPADGRGASRKAAKSWLPPPATRRRASGQAGRRPRGRRDSEAIRGRRAAARPARCKLSSATVAWDGRPPVSQGPSSSSPYSRCRRIRRPARWTSRAGISTFGLPANNGPVASTTHAVVPVAVRLIGDNQRGSVAAAGRTRE